jgi:hypothetical protein
MKGRESKDGLWTRNTLNKRIKDEHNKEVATIHEGDGQH